MHSKKIAPTHITSVEFRNFKALKHYSFRLDGMNILVGPNNCGKSTILGAFRSLWACMRRARSKSPDVIDGPDGEHFGYRISEEALPISVENVHTDYADEDTTVIFRLSNGNTLKLFFHRDGGAVLFAITDKGQPRTPSKFKAAFPITIKTVPVLGPVEHREALVSPETVQKELSSHRASRHFRNYWHYFPDGFGEFASLVEKSWPGMEILPPERPDYMNQTIAMFCLENRIARELFWSGFGFQVWCQLLTHVARSSTDSLLVIDEPEIYLHPDVQRQLLGILREAGPDVLLATHSTEIMGEADPAEIVLVDKTKRSAKRLRDIEGVQAALDLVGSVQNITLTQLARNRRVVFVEDDEDFVVLRRFAKKLGFSEVAAGLDLTPVKSEGFSSWERISSVAWGLEKTLGRTLLLGAIYDRDYWCDEEIDYIKDELSKHLHLVHFHSRKEIENYMLVPPVLERALRSEVLNRCSRTKSTPPDIESIEQALDAASESLRGDALSQYAARRAGYLKNTGKDPATLYRETAEVFERKWANLADRMMIVPGKTLLRMVREDVQKKYKVNLTNTTIIDAFHKDEIPQDIEDLVTALEDLRTTKVSWS